VAPSFTPVLLGARTFGSIEEATPPAKSNVDDVYHVVVAREAWFRSGRLFAQVDSATQTRIKRLNALF
jgi:hypothetical protein